MTRRLKIDYTGQRLGMLTVIGVVGKDNGGNTLWLCRCDCGREIRVRSFKMKTVKSCRCGRRKKSIVFDPRSHAVWKAMRSRCENPRAKDWKYYGARGIFVCDRWKDFHTFHQDVGCRPSNKHSLDRINNDGPYSPENCRWATQDQQCQNRSDNVVINYQGRSATAKEWADLYGVSSRAVRYRFKKTGDPEYALGISTPLTVRKRSDRKRKGK